MMINVLTLQGENCCCSLLGPNTLYDNSQLTIMLKKCQATIACYLNRPMMILNSYISQFWVKNSLPES